MPLCVLALWSTFADNDVYDAGVVGGVVRGTAIASTGRQAERQEGRQ